MKNIISKLSCVAISALLAVSCAESWKDKTNNEWETKYVWSIAEMSNGVLNRAYSDLPSTLDGYGNNFLDVATDNAATNLYTSSAYLLSQGGISPTSNPTGVWASAYRNIQYVNSFLENGLGENVRYNKVDEAIDAAYKRQYYGEAMFLRAYWQFRLLQVYGGKGTNGKALGFPIRKSFVDEDAAMDFEKITRNSYAECVQQIIDDCDSAIANLPTAYEGSDVVVGSAYVGKPTKLAAGALKAITALYAASPANQDDAVVTLDAPGEYTVNDPAAYKAGWEFAAKTADEVLRMEGFGTEYTALKKTDLADAGNTTPSEFLFRFFANNRAMELHHFPPYYQGKGNTEPSQNLVDAYPMSNGYPISETVKSGYDASHPYEGREARFYNTVYYDGSMFGNSGVPMNMMAGGKDSYTYNENASRTGYYLAKFLSVKSGMLTPTALSNSQHYIPLLRRAYVFLAYAEAANEAWGPKDKDASCLYTAYDIIKSIREKSGGIVSTSYLDEVAAEGKDAFAQLVQNERRLELAFENQRYFDLRRRLMKLDEPVRGVELTVSETGQVVYNTEKFVSERKFSDKRYYYSPLPYDERAKNPNLVENLGWN